MRVGVIQSSYIPWRGYFDFIQSVDVFVIYDDVQYSAGSWRNRNKVKTRHGLHWLTVPVRYDFGDPIDKVLIGQPTGRPWQDIHRRLLIESLGHSPYFTTALEIWESVVSKNDAALSKLNQCLMAGICTYLGIDTPMVRSRDYSLSGSKTDRLIELLLKLGAKRYLSGPMAKDYIEEMRFAEAGIVLEYKSYDYQPYRQQWGEFSETVTALDLIANCGPESRKLLKSQTPDTVAVNPQGERGSVPGDRGHHGLH